MLEALKNRAANTAKRAGLLTGGLLAITVGLAFLTAAAWFYLLAVMGAQLAALVIGGVYAGVGLIMLGVASAGAPHGRQTEHHQPQDAARSHPVEQPPLMQAFFHGMQAGVSATQARH